MHAVISQLQMHCSLPENCRLCSMLLQGPLIVMYVQCARDACMQLLNLIPNPGWIWDALHSATYLAIHSGPDHCSCKLSAASTPGAHVTHRCAW